MLKTLHQDGILAILDHSSSYQQYTAANFTILEPIQGLSFSCWIATQDHDAVVHKIRTSTKQAITIYRQLLIGSLHSIIVLWQPNDFTVRCVILQPPALTPLWSCLTPSTFDSKQPFMLHGTEYHIESINAIPIPRGIVQPSNGDILQLQPRQIIAAGGHHLSGAPRFLPSDATFPQRAEFATNSHGWLAADEMSFICQHLLVTPHRCIGTPSPQNSRRVPLDPRPFGQRQLHTFPYWLGTTGAH